MIHEDLIERFARFFSRMPSSIYEIGSRDGEDAARLAAAAPDAQVVAFECNPDTVATVQCRLANVPNARAIDLAVTDFDGATTFHKIDPHKTVTTWEDGNPGASSLFVATGKYPIEQYVQTPVSVHAGRLDTLINAEAIPSPELVWIDVQGAELAALRGLGVHLGQVGLLYVELSFLEIYEGQPLAKDVIRFLRRAGFTIAAIPWKGDFQCEVLFVNLRHLGPLARSRAFMQGLSLQLTASSLGQSWSRRGAADFAAKLRQARRFAGMIAIRGSNKVKRKWASDPDNSRVTARGVRWVLRWWLLRALRWRRAKTGPSFSQDDLARALRTEFAATLPIAGPKPSAPGLRIEAFIPCAVQDYGALALVVDGLTRCVEEGVVQVILATPSSSIDGLEHVIGNRSVTVVSDEDLLSADVQASVVSGSPANREGWVRQQLLKLAFCRDSQADRVIVCDADTILLRPRRFTEGLRDVVLVAEEFHQPYYDHIGRVFGDRAPQPLFSTVCHHMLFRPSLVREMLAEIEALHPASDALAILISKLDVAESSCMSEYELYGQWITARKPKLVAHRYFGNVGLRREADGSVHIPENLRTNPLIYSVSAHWYLAETR